MRYLPHMEDDIRSMLETVGIESLDALFSTIPGEQRMKAPLELPQALTEWELNSHMEHLAGLNASSSEYMLFIGAGCYEHYIPQVVASLIQRGEFVTSYTPYQPEISQGTLQALYEYQTLVNRLLGMEVANASMYDGASALAEALLMALRITGRNRVAVSQCIHPMYRAVAETYLAPSGFTITEISCGRDGRTDLQSLEDMDDVASVAIQSPNFFGCIEDLSGAAEMAHRNGAIFISAFSEPLAYGLLQNPGSQGADIVCGEGRSLGLPQSFGGTTLGMFATKREFVRNMPGRLIGKTVDRDGRRGFVVTLSTREQHIRREKATSNICTNQSLCAIQAAMYMATLGRMGLREVARLNYNKAEYLKMKLREAGFSITFNAPTFNEFVVEFPKGFGEAYERLIDRKIVAGFPLAQFYPEMGNKWLLCATETKTKEDIDTFVNEVTTCMNL